VAQGGSQSPLPTPILNSVQATTMQRLLSISVAIIATLMIGDYVLEGARAGLALTRSQVCQSAN